MALLGWENIVENTGAVLVGSSSVSTLTPEMLRLPQGAPTVAWQTASGSVTASLSITPPSTTSWRAVCLSRTNLTSAATLRVRLGSPTVWEEAAPTFSAAPITVGWTSPFTVTRTHTPTTASATVFDSTGTLVEVGQNTVRVTHNPTTLERQGLLLEPDRVNLVRNPRMQGAASGTPGTVPTNGWVITSGTSGINRRIVGVTTVNGMPVLDVEFTCSSVLNTGIFFYADSPAATASSTYTGGAYLSVVSGTPPSTLRWLTQTNAGDRPSAGFALNSTLRRLTSTITVPTGGTLARFALQNQQANYTGVFVLRIGGCQVELGEFETSLIFPPAGSPQSATRAADTVLYTVPANSGSVSLFAEFVVSATGSAASEFFSIRLRKLNDNNNSIRLRANGGTPVQMDAVATIGSTIVRDSNPANLTVGSVTRRVLRSTPTNFSHWADGVLVDSLAGVVLVPEQFTLSASGMIVLVREVRLYSELTDAQTVALSGAGTSLTPPTYDSGAVSAGVARGVGQALHILPTAVSAPAMRIDIADTANPDQYLNIPLAYAGPAYEVPISISSDTGLEVRRSDTQTRGGTIFTEALSASRSWQFSAEYLYEAEATWLRDLEVAASVGENVLFVPRTAYSASASETVYGLLSPGRRGFVTHDGSIYRWTATISERL